MASIGEISVVRKYPKTPHLPFSPGVQGDDVVIPESELCTLPLLNEETVLTEKLDGANCSIYRGSVYSRTVASVASHLSFGPIKELASQLSYVIPDNIQLYGENMFGIHSIVYDGLRSYFYVFAGLRDSMEWMGWDEVCQLADELDLPTVPALARQTFSSFDEIKLAIQVGKSQCGNTSAEGVVLRTVSGFPVERFERHVAKYVRENHIQTEPTWRRTWKQATLKQGTA